MCKLCPPVYLINFATVLTVSLTRLLVIRSLPSAPWLLTRLRSNWVQVIGFTV